METVLYLRANRMWSELQRN